MFIVFIKDVLYSYVVELFLFYGDFWWRNMGFYNIVFSIFDLVCYYGDWECDIVMSELFVLLFDVFCEVYNVLYLL